MRFTVCVEQNVPRFDVPMQNAVFMRVMHGAGHFRDKFHRLPDRHGSAPDNFIKLAAFHELHAEVTGAIALADFVNRNNAWMFEAGGRFRFQPEALDVRFRGPLAKSNDF